MSVILGKILHSQRINDDEEALIKQLWRTCWRMIAGIANLIISSLVRHACKHQYSGLLRNSQEGHAPEVPKDYSCWFSLVSNWYSNLALVAWSRIAWTVKVAPSVLGWTSKTTPPFLCNHLKSTKMELTINFLPAQVALMRYSQARNNHSHVFFMLNPKLQGTPKYFFLRLISR